MRCEDETENRIGVSGDETNFWMNVSCEYFLFFFFVVLTYQLCTIWIRRAFCFCLLRLLYICVVSFYIYIFVFAEFQCLCARRVVLKWSVLQEERLFFVLSHNNANVWDENSSFGIDICWNNTQGGVKIGSVFQPWWQFSNDAIFFLLIATIHNDDRQTCTLMPPRARYWFAGCLLLNVERCRW